MKKMLSILLALSLMALPIIGFADYASMSDDELMAELNQIRAEMVKRSQAKEGKTILAEADGITVTLKGEPEWNDSYDGTHYIVLNVTVVNSSEEAVGIRTDDCYVNGWKIGAGFQTSLEPGMKTKDTITIYKVDEDAEVEKLEDLEDIKITFLTFNANTFMTKTMDITTTLTF